MNLADERDPNFAIAFSFPSEHRQFVQKVAARLAESGKLSRDLIFYDNWHQPLLLGVKLDEKLAEIYGERSELIVPFFSEYYSKKWCGIEWDSIRPLLLNRARQNSVLPIHMDGTVIPAWPDTALGIRRGRKTAKEVADIILEKYLDRHWRRTPSQGGQGLPAPVTQDDATLLPPSVFISHHHGDLSFAEQVKSRLAIAPGPNGAPICVPWLAADDIDPGDEYRQMIDEALRKARAVVIVLSPESCESMYVTYEWAYALGRGIPVIPVLVRSGGTIHPRLQVLQHIGFDNPAEQPWKRLLDAVSRKIMQSDTMVIKPVEIELLKNEIRSEVAKDVTVQGNAHAASLVHAAIDTLLVIDIQRDFFDEGALSVPGAESLIGPLNKAIAAARAAGMKLMFSRDWHPPNHQSFVNMSPTGAWPRHCVQNTPGAAFHPKLKVPTGSDIIDIGVDNTRMGYSAFEDGQLAQVLESPDSGTLYLAGLALEYCVQATALEAIGKYKKRVVIIEDLVRATAQDLSQLAPLWRELQLEGVERHVGKAPFLLSRNNLSGHTPPPVRH